MMLFRKSKLLKIVKEYHRVYHQEIPEMVIGKEELEALRDIELEQLAIMYDNLKGYEYFKEHVDGIEISLAHHMPDRSRSIPSLRYQPRVEGLRRQVRIYKNIKFLVGNDYILDATASSSAEFIPGGSKCWKLS